MRETYRYVEAAETAAESGLNGPSPTHEDRMQWLAYAQVMATLAVASATKDLKPARMGGPR